MKFADARYSNEMEDLILNTSEQEVLERYKSKIQKRYNVEILMPDVDHNSSTDLIFASISGEKTNIEKVKAFISRRIKMNHLTKSIPNPKSEARDVIVVTLSDDEEEDLATTGDFKDDSVCIIEKSFAENSPKIKTEILPVPNSNSLENSVCIIDTSYICENTQESCTLNKRKAYKREAPRDRRQNNHQKVRPNTVLSSSDAEDSEICEVSSTTDEPTLKKAKCLDDCLQREPSKISHPAPDFLPLFIASESSHQKNNASNKRRSPGPSASHAAAIAATSNKDDEIVVLDESDIEQPLPSPRKLRPIVIDGSNVARSHGTTTKSFSAKGIQICVEYFLNRGHTQVTAFVPQFRRHADRWKSFPTTDTQILEDLAEKQHVVFTPSRRVNGRRISSYDDRFVVELAAQNGGVIVSNDNFYDLVEESEAFREAIEERLLQFLFVGDVFMVPKDPLGRNGPTLEEYLSFSPEKSADTQNN